MTADRTAALEAIDKALYPNHTTQWPFDALNLSRAALLSTAKEADRMREALRTVQLARLNGLFDASVALQINGDVAGVFAEVDAALLPSEGTKTK